MSITIELEPTIEDWLREQGERRGMGAPEYAQYLIRQQVLAGVSGQQRSAAGRSHDERLRAFRNYVESHDPSLAPLPPEAFDRASIYGERG